MLITQSDQELFLSNSISIIYQLFRKTPFYIALISFLCLQYLGSYIPKIFYIKMVIMPTLAFHSLLFGTIILIYLSNKKDLSLIVRRGKTLYFLTLFELNKYKTIELDSIEKISSNLNMLNFWSYGEVMPLSYVFEMTKKDFEVFQIGFVSLNPNISVDVETSYI
ncbi:MAG: hypothetical protein HC932_05515 [Thermales bacterium]|nr:hypothetical protein [Thermales bacterium]